VYICSGVTIIERPRSLKVPHLAVEAELSFLGRFSRRKFFFCCFVVGGGDSPPIEIINISVFFGNLETFYNPGNINAILTYDIHVLMYLRITFEINNFDYQ
jgi:hypothetical protein